MCQRHLQAIALQVCCSHIRQAVSVEVSYTGDLRSVPDRLVTVVKEALIRNRRRFPTDYHRFVSHEKTQIRVAVIIEISHATDEGRKS